MDFTNHVELEQDDQLPVLVADSHKIHGKTAFPECSISFPVPEDSIKIPSNTHISLMTKDCHQGIVDYTHQTLSDSVPLRPNYQDMNKETMTRCRTNTSHSRVARAKREHSNKAYSRIKPYAQKKAASKKTMGTIAEATSKAQSKAQKSRYTSKVHLRPYRDRVIHLLALKDYKKPELLLQLKKDGILKKDKDSLGKVLQQVATLNSKNFSYTLRDCMYKEIQRDWPGYSEEDRALLDLVLARKLKQDQKDPVTNHQEQSSTGLSTDNTSLLQHSDSDYIDPLRRKKVRISHLTNRVKSTSQAQLNDNNREPAADLSPRVKSTSQAQLNDNNREPAADLSPNFTITAGTALPPLLSPCSSISNSPQALHSISDSEDTPEETEDAHHDNHGIFEHEEDRHTPLKMLSKISIKIKYPRLPGENHSTADDKLKYPCVEFQVNDQICTIETERTRHPGGTKKDFSKCLIKIYTAAEDRCSTSMTSDYLPKYSTIVSFEQRQHYVQAFNEAYEEFQTLRTKIKDSTSPFLMLRTKRNFICPDTGEIQDDNEEIKLEYRKIKHSNSSFHAEKERCQYLYNKLSYIKRLILNFDQKQIEV
ncbi:RNA polymerase II elongation factor ELL2-like [Rhynchocyon petersi]